MVFALTNNSGGTITTGSTFVSVPVSAFGSSALTPDSTQIASGDTAYFAIAFVPTGIGELSPTTVTVNWTGAAGSPLTFNVQGTGQ